MNGEIWTNLLTSGITLIAAIAFGFIVEAIIEYFFAPIFDFEKLKRWEGKPIVMKWIPLAPAILLTIYYKIDIVSYFLNVLARRLTKMESYRMDTGSMKANSKLSKKPLAKKKPNCRPVVSLAKQNSELNKKRN